MSGRASAVNQVWFSARLTLAAKTAPINAFRQLH